MRNWSKSVYVIDGDAKEVKELYGLMKDLGSRKEPFIKNGFGTKWLGCMVDALGKDWNEVSCRGEWANLEINGDTLRFTTETAWTPCNEVLDFACQFFRHSTTIILLLSGGRTEMCHLLFQTTHYYKRAISSQTCPFNVVKL